MALLTTLPVRMIERFAGRLRFPVLFFLTAALFVADLFVPDAIPLVDEILLGLLTVLLGSWKRRKRDDDPSRSVETTGPES
ncbi:MAG: DUF6116 family protein [Gemmatimonadota bacterium]